MLPLKVWTFLNFVLWTIFLVLVDDFTAGCAVFLIFLLNIDGVTLAVISNTNREISKLERTFPHPLFPTGSPSSLGTWHCVTASLQEVVRDYNDRTEQFKIKGNIITSTYQAVIINLNREINKFSHHVFASGYPSSLKNNVYASCFLMRSACTTLGTGHYLCGGWPIFFF